MNSFRAEMKFFSRTIFSTRNIFFRQKIKRQRKDLWRKVIFRKNVFCRNRARLIRLLLRSR